MRKFADKEQTHKRFKHWGHSNPLWILGGAGQYKTYSNNNLLLWIILGFSFGKDVIPPALNIILEGYWCSFYNEGVPPGWKYKGWGNAGFCWRSILLIWLLVSLLTLKIPIFYTKLLKIYSLGNSIIKTKYMI